MSAKLNAALSPELADKSLETLCRDYCHLPAIRNNGGGHWNHSLFWLLLSPQGGGQAQGLLADAINKSFGSFASFKEAFTEAALTRFGSGWAWLCQVPTTDAPHALQICSTAQSGQSPDA